MLAYRNNSWVPQQIKVAEILATSVATNFGTATCEFNQILQIIFCKHDSFRTI